MKFSSTLLPLCFYLFHSNPANAAPTPKEILEKLGYGVIEERDIPCGLDGQYTCTGGQACYTNAQQIAYCSVPAAAATPGPGGYQVYTTTYTAQETFTSTYSVWFSSAPPASSPVVAICNTGQDETSCGPICCAGNQVCASSGSCAPRPSSAAITGQPTTIATSYSAPLRPTSGTATGTYTTAATVSGTAYPTVANSTSSGLSGGAIAGIVIGTIAGVIILLLICFCCILKAGFDGLLAIFGLGKDKRSSEKVEVIEERYSRHGSAAASRRGSHANWFGAGGRPARVEESRKKQSSGFGGLGAVGAGLITLAVILGLKRRHDRKEQRVVETRTEISDSYYSDSYTGTSASSASSDRRTRQSRQSRGSRMSRPPPRAPPSRAREVTSRHNHRLFSA